MMKFMDDLGWVIIGSFAIFAYAMYVLVPVINKTNQTLGKPLELEGKKGLEWIKVKLYGWKTFILLGLSGMVQIVQSILTEEALTSAASVPWATYFDEHVAGKISAVLLTLAAVSHVYGTFDAARRTPVEDVK